MKKPINHASDQAPWSGYDYDQLVYLQAVNLVRRQALGERLTAIISTWRHPFRRLPDGVRPGFSIGRQLMGVLLHSIDKMDYVILGVSIYKHLRRLLKGRK